MLRSALKLRENSELVPRALGVRMRDLQQDGAVALHDQRAIRHNRPVYCATTMAARMLETRRSVRSTSAKLDLIAQASAAEARRFEEQFSGRAIRQTDGDVQRGASTDRRFELAIQPGCVSVGPLVRTQRGGAV